MTEDKEKEVNVPLKYNPETGKYEADDEALNKKIEEANKKPEENNERTEDKKESQESKEESSKNDEESSKESKPEEKEPKKAKKEKSNGSFKPIIFIMLISLVIAGLWNQVPAIKNGIHAVLDPTAGAMLDWNLTIGMLIIIIIITLATTFAQKYGTDQETLKELKKEQKDLQKEMKDNKNNQKKMMELQKKQMKLMPQQMKLSMRAVMYTGVPFILLIRWFQDYFVAAGDPKFFGFLSWFWFYLLGIIILSSILRKQMDVV